ncbi:MAG: glycosyltransferase family 9 protein [Verrucomicrobiales bacterium]|nr:glycosyltransferase family 9 protein [Verrucomicrobiales bacterium]
MGKILFIRGGAVGDFILTMPAIKLVKEQLPDNQLTVLGYQSITELAKVTGLVNETRSIEDAKLATFFAPRAELDGEWCRFLAEFDVVISYLYDPDGFFAGNLERAGVKTLLVGPFKPSNDAPATPAALQLAEPLSQLALFLDDPELSLTYPSDSPALISKTGAYRIGIHPGSGSPTKNWPFEAWADLLSEIHSAKEGVEFVVTSGEAEYEQIDRFLDLLRERGLPFAHLYGKSLTDLGATFGQLDFYLGNDSGISHLAGSTGIPGLLLFGPTDPEVWAPASSVMEVFRSPERMMQKIEVSQVMDHLRKSHLFTPL